MLVYRTAPSPTAIGNIRLVLKTPFAAGAVTPSKNAMPFAAVAVNPYVDVVGTIQKVAELDGL